MGEDVRWHERRVGGRWVGGRSGREWCERRWRWYWRDGVRRQRLSFAWIAATRLVWHFLLSMYQSENIASVSYLESHLIDIVAEDYGGIWRGEEEGGEGEDEDK